MRMLSTIARHTTAAMVAVSVMAAAVAPAFAQTPPDLVQKKYIPVPGQGQRQAAPQQPQRQAAPVQQQRQAPPPVFRPAPPPPQAYGRPAPQVYARPAPPPPRFEEHHHRRPYYNPGVAIGVGAAIIGATLGYRYYRGPNRDSTYERCQRNFPDFDWDSGTFENEDGERELCPYLRPYLD